MLHKLMISLLLSCAVMGCTKTDPTVFMKAYATSLATCNGEVGCLMGVQGALYTGAFREQDTATNLIGAFVPWLNIGLELTRLIYGGSGGNGQGFVLNRSNNNTFIMPKNTADRSSKIDAPFSATTSKTQSWENMYNPITDNSRDQVVK